MPDTQKTDCEDEMVVVVSSGCTGLDLRHWWCCCWPEGWAGCGCVGVSGLSRRIIQTVTLPPSLAAGQQEALLDYLLLL